MEEYDSIQKEIISFFQDKSPAQRLLWFRQNPSAEIGGEGHGLKNLSAKQARQEKDLCWKNPIPLLLSKK